MARHQPRRHNREKRRKKAKSPFRSFGNVAAEAVKAKPSSIAVPIEPMGLGGQKQALVSVPVRLAEGRQVDGAPGGRQGVYTATIGLRKPDIPLRGEGDFRFDSNLGDSHVIVGAQTEAHIDVTYNDGHQHAKLICLPNDRGAFPKTDTNRWTVSTGGGLQPLWSHTGRELFFRTLTGALMRVPVDRGAEWSIRPPTMLLDARAYVVGTMAAVGEPFVFGMPGQDASAFVKQRGLAVVSDFSYGDLGSRYLPKGRSLPARSANRICTAVVP